MKILLSFNNKTKREKKIKQTKKERSERRDETKQNKQQEFKFELKLKGAYFRHFFLLN